MKRLIVFSFLICGALMLMSLFVIEANDEPWKASQLIQASDLAEILNDAKREKPIIYSVGPGADIKGSIEIGAVAEQENYHKFREILTKLDRNTSIVIVCGCCPFEHCPNIRPAFELLNEMKFTNHKLLNLPNNLKTDWIDKNYPMK